MAAASGVADETAAGGTGALFCDPIKTNWVTGEGARLRAAGVSKWISLDLTIYS